MGVSSFRSLVFFLWSFRSVTSGTEVPPRPPRRQGPLRSPPPRKKTRGGGSPPCAGSGRVGGPVAGGRVGSVFGPVSLVWSFGGVLWLGLVSPLRLRRLRWSVPLGSRSPLGRVRPWAFPSAPRRAPFPVSWRSRGFPRSPLRLGFRRRGLAGSRVLAVWLPFAPFARFPLALALRRPGWCPFRWPRRLFRSVVGALRAPWRPCSPLVAPPLALSRAGASFRVRGGSPRRLPRPPRRWLGGCVVCRLPLAAGGWRRLPPRRLVWSARAGLRRSRRGLAGGGGAPAGPAPLSVVAAAWGFCPRWRSRASGFAAAGPSARWRFAPRAGAPRPAPGFSASFLVAPLRGALPEEMMK